MAARYDSEQGRLDSLTDDYINAYQKQINNLNELLNKKEEQNLELLQKFGYLKTYASGMREELERRYTKEGKLMPKDFQEAPVALDPEGHKNMLADVRRSMSRKEDLLAAGRIE